MSESVQTIDDLRLSFIQRLNSIGQSFVSAKPLVFLVHSLGGMLLKRALVEMANSNDKETFMLESVCQIVFFGVPNQE
jgi:esterase/lipase superfamily enzyme